jgi:hypothetical protein
VVVGVGRRVVRVIGRVDGLGLWWLSRSDVMSQFVTFALGSNSHMRLHL